jgi:hypothetical protein
LTAQVFKYTPATKKARQIWRDLVSVISTWLGWVTACKPVSRLQPKRIICQKLYVLERWTLASPISFALSCITMLVNPALFRPIAADKPAIPAPTMTILRSGILAFRLSCGHQLSSQTNIISVIMLLTAENIADMA